MTIVQTVNVQLFRDAFVNMGRKENFSHAGLEALYDYLEDLSDDTDEPVELDVIALCCDYSEHTMDSLINEYGYLVDSSGRDDFEDYHDALLDVLRDNTTVIEFENSSGELSYIIQSF